MSRVAGVDGCRAGWIAVLCDPDGGQARIELLPRLELLLDRAEPPAIVAVDMPIGLPDRVGPGGRPPERMVRAFLGERQSSVFSVPARAAVEAETYPEACAAALATSDPPRKVSKQCFHLFPKIREVDALLRERPDWRDRVVESHPEVAFAVLNGHRPMSLPKKVKGRPDPDGIEERRRVLRSEGLDPAVVDAVPPRGAGPDDLIDACVCALVAARRSAGLAIAHPADDRRDAFGLRIAIWA